MFFKNKSTGLVWEVTHPDHIKRCKKDSNYQEVKPEKKTTPKTSTKRNAAPKEVGE